MWALVRRAWSLSLLTIPVHLPAATVQRQDYVLILVDASGSMRHTDPGGYRKLAIQALLSLLPESTQVAIVEFGEKARVLVPWGPITPTVLEQALNVGEFDLYTDFALAFFTAMRMFQTAPEQSRKSLILLTDGRFEPNPRWEHYSPYWLEFARNTRGKSQREAYRFYDQVFRSRLLPVAERVLFDEVLQQIQRKGIEIFAIGFGSDVDQTLLQRIVRITTRSPQEVRYFHTMSAPELVEAFLSILTFLENQMILDTRAGNVSGDSEGVVYLDQYLRDVRMVFVLDRPARVEVFSPSGDPERRFSRLHPNLSIFRITEKFPGTWQYHIQGNSTRYRLLVVGQSLIFLEIQGLQPVYHVGETLKISVHPIFQGHEAYAFLDPSSKYTLHLWWDTQAPPEEKTLPIRQSQVVHPLLQEGKARFRITLFARDRKGRPMLPRPGKTLTFEVKPRFWVEPEEVSFGNLGQKDTGKALIHIVYGKSVKGPLNITGEFSHTSQCKDTANFPRIPRIQDTVAPGEALQETLRVFPPQKGCWGDFQGTFHLTAPTGESVEVPFRIHYTSIWERLTRSSLIALSLFLLVLIAASLWFGQMSAPYGQLEVVKGPEIYPTFFLRRVRRGWMTRLLNWKRNQVTIGGKGAHIHLESLPSTVRLALTFHPRYVMIRNLTRKSNWRVELRGPMGPLVLRPGERAQLHDNMEIAFYSSDVNEPHYVLRYKK